MKVVTCIAPVNIAIIKYWGKSNEELIIPLNDSLSGTLSKDHMCAKTTIMSSPTFTQSKFWLNGKEQSLDNKRLQNCLKEVKRRANQELPHLNWNIVICSENNFPTAAGLASSAAGYACLVFALAQLYNIEGNVSSIGRMGSGSACRSFYGGWVRWCKGTDDTGEDSVAVQVAPVSHWPEMRLLILVVNDERKKYSSTTGMATSVATSELLKYRANEVVPKRIEAMKDAILRKDFDTFARITMQDSNQFHAICLDTFPPCFYMNDTSHAVIELVQVYNKYKVSNKVAYTFDAGPNACIYLLESEVEEFLSLINYAFPTNSNNDEYFKGIPITPKPVPEELKKCLDITQQSTGCFKYIIYTKLGDGPKLLDNSEEHLLDDSGNLKRL